MPHTRIPFCLVTGLLVGLQGFALLMLALPGPSRWDVVALLGLATIAVVALAAALLWTRPAPPGSGAEPPKPLPQAMNKAAGPDVSCEDCEAGETVQDGVILPLPKRTHRPGS